MSLEKEKERARDGMAQYLGMIPLEQKMMGASDHLDTLVAQAYLAGADAMMEGLEEIKISRHTHQNIQKRLEDEAHNALVQKLKEKRSNI